MFFSFTCEQNLTYLKKLEQTNFRESRRFDKKKANAPYLMKTRKWILSKNLERFARIYMKTVIEMQLRCQILVLQGLAAARKPVGRF